MPTLLPPRVRKSLRSPRTIVLSLRLKPRHAAYFQ